MSSNAPTGEASDRGGRISLKLGLRTPTQEHYYRLKVGKSILASEKSTSKAQDLLRKSENDQLLSNEAFATDPTAVMHGEGTPRATYPSNHQSRAKSIPTPALKLKFNPKRLRVPATSNRPGAIGRSTETTTNSGTFTVTRYRGSNPLSNPRTYEVIEAEPAEPARGMLTLKLDPDRFKQKLREMGQLRNEP